MYKWTVRTLVRRGIERLNAGDPSFLLRMTAPNVELCFPGDNSWATMFRPTEAGRARHVTHRGIDEARAFAQRFVEEGVTFEIEDILVNGGPWNTRIALRAHNYIATPAGDTYNNRVVAVLELRWGRLHRWEDYEDTQRVAAWDRRRTLVPVSES
jgi:ketosteroid isomerase-like protein